MTLLAKDGIVGTYYAESSIDQKITFAVDSTYTLSRIDSISPSSCSYLSFGRWQQQSSDVYTIKSDYLRSISQVPFNEGQDMESFSTIDFFSRFQLSHELNEAEYTISYSRGLSLDSIYLEICLPEDFHEENHPIHFYGDVNKESLMFFYANKRISYPIDTIDHNKLCHVYVKAVNIKNPYYNTQSQLVSIPLYDFYYSENNICKIELLTLSDCMYENQAYLNSQILRVDAQTIYWKGCLWTRSF